MAAGTSFDRPAHPWTPPLSPWEPIQLQRAQDSQPPQSAPVKDQEPSLAQLFWEKLEIFRALIVTDLTVFITNLKNRVSPNGASSHDVEQATLLLNNILDCQEVFDKTVLAPISPLITSIAQQATNFTANEVNFIFSEMSKPLLPTPVNHGGFGNPLNGCYASASIQALGATRFFNAFTADLGGITSLVKTFLSVVESGITVTLAEFQTFITTLFDINQRDCFNPNGRHGGPLLQDQDEQHDPAAFTTHLLGQYGFKLDTEIHQSMANGATYRRAYSDVIYRLTIADELLPVALQSLMDKRHSSVEDVSCEEEIVFKSAPVMLPVQIVRFDNAGNKVKTILDIPPNQIVNIKVKDRDVTIEKSYKLQSFVVHLGEEAKSGHIITYRKKGNDWIRCDDNSVRAASPEEAQRMSRQAYLLYFDPA